MKKEIRHVLRITPAKKGKIDLGRFRVAYRIYGHSGPFIICVNGAQQTMASWHAAVLKFSGSYRIILYDAPGQARGSILSGSAAVNIDEQVEVLRGLIHAVLGAREDLHLVGASWGAVIAAIYAARYPERVKFLLLASFGLQPSPQMMKVVEGARELYFSEHRSDGAKLIINMFGQRLSEENKRRMILQFQNLTNEQFDSFYEHIKVIASTSHLTDYADLGKIRAKTVIVNGADDQLLDNRDLEAASKLIPHNELRIIPDAGHFLHLEREEILDIYGTYLKANIPVLSAKPR
ncbi:MAG: alpha/beta hydrolase [Candidatus Omnitrophota bacterium]